MKISSYLSYKNNQIDENDYIRIFKLIEQLNLPKLKDINRKFNNLMNNDKKNIDNKLNYIMLNKIGEASIVENFDKKEILMFRNNMNILVINGPNLIAWY